MSFMLASDVKKTAIDLQLPMNFSKFMKIFNTFKTAQIDLQLHIFVSQLHNSSSAAH